MRIDFGDYSYVNPYDKDDVSTPEKYNSKGFNSAVFNNYINNYQFNQAAEYASQFKFNDVDKQREHIHRLNELRNKGRKQQAIFSKYKGTEYEDAIRFHDFVFAPKGLEKISNNVFKDKFERYKNRIGNSNGNEAQYLSLTFSKTKQFLWWDVDKDENYSIDSFYDRSGLNEETLKSKGVKVNKNNDGSTTLIFAKNNDLANSILYNSSVRKPPSFFSNGELMAPDIRGLNKDKDGNYVNSSKYDAAGDIYNIDLENMMRVVDAANKNCETAYSKNINTKDYSSIVGGYLDDGLEELNEAYRNGFIDEKEYLREYKHYRNGVDEVLKGVNLNSLKVYSDYNGGGTPNTVMKEMNQENRQLLNSILLGTKPSDMSIQAMSSNGEYGVQIVIHSKLQKDNDLKYNTDLKGRIKAPEIRIFVPGLFSEEARAKISRNTNTRAMLELNDMQDYGYDYDLEGGKKLVYKDNGTYKLKNGNVEHDITHDEAIGIINKDMIIKDAKETLPFKYMNKDGVIFDKDGYERDAKQLALATANELMPNVYIPNIDGTPLQFKTIEDIENLFNRFYTHNGGVDLDAAQYINNDAYMKLLEMFDVYNQLLKNLEIYK